MGEIWGSTKTGELFYGRRSWTAEIREDEILLRVAGAAETIPCSQLQAVRVRRGLIWAKCCFEFLKANQSCRIELKGIPNREALAMQRAMFAAAVRCWINTWRHLITQERWVAKGEARRILIRNRAPEWPGVSWKDATGDSGPEETLQQAFGKNNDIHLAQQRERLSSFFERVERKPLSEEQILACVCMDDNVMIVAAAGAGKTSTMVAKTGYALRAGLAKPEEILLLAFNHDTATELQQRVDERLRSIPDIEKVRSKTFHAFGLEVIGMATGKKPGLAPWLDGPGKDCRELANIIETLSKKDAQFELDWNLFRTVYARDTGKWGDRQETDSYKDGKRGFLTANGEIVKSKEERLIADWLFYHGVDYQYERPYEHDTADAAHRQYRPDFYYPAARLYHEHFALNAQGRPPPHFEGNYLEGVEWKRRIHAQKRTAFIETSSATLSSGEAFRHLKSEFLKRGIPVRFDPNRPAIGLGPVDKEQLIRTFRVFQRHVKNNGLTAAQLQEALSAQSSRGQAVRLKTFLSLYEGIAGEWERRLAASACIDFEDMLLQAADHLEAGRYTSPYKIVLADEFQDSSRARIRLLKALTKSPPFAVHLCAVGDDWQGINRFAGADISVMTEFEQVFENATRLTLSTTFRCPQSICDVSSTFVQQNPLQIRKTVRATNLCADASLRAFALEHKQSIPGFVEGQLEGIQRDVLADQFRSSKRRKTKIMLLGRYNQDRPLDLAAWGRKFSGLDIEFRTVHSSKGQEADYVFVLNTIEGTKGFPSQIEDDPALQLAMPTPDPYPFAEERRIFYVALTRARAQVRFYTTTGAPSQFLVELLNRGHLTIEAIAEGRQSRTDPPCKPLETCPKCRRGGVIPRQGPYGLFHSCSRFPRCDYKRSAR